MLACAACVGEVLQVVNTVFLMSARLNKIIYSDKEHLQFKDSKIPYMLYTVQCTMYSECEYITCDSAVQTRVHISLVPYNILFPSQLSDPRTRFTLITAAAVMCVKSSRVGRCDYRQRARRQGSLLCTDLAHGDCNPETESCQHR